MLLLITFCGATFAAPEAARAEPLPLGPLTCTAGANTSGEAFAFAPGDLDCGEDRFDWDTRFVRTHTDVGNAYLPPAELLLWQTDPSAFDSMLLRFSYADGSDSLIDVDPQMAARNWFADGRFSVPVPGAGAPLVAVDMVVERPRHSVTTQGPRLIDAASAGREHFVRALVYALVCGLLLNPIIYDLLFYRVLRARFMLWHIAMTVAVLAFTLTHSGLVFELIPDLALLTRWQIYGLSLTVAIACAVLFMRRLLEEGAVPALLDRMLIGSVAAMVAARCLSLLDIEALRIAGNRLLLFSLIPVAFAAVAAVIVALARGSRAARFMAIALSGMIIAGLMRLARGIGFEAVLSIDDVLCGALVLMTLGTSAAVGDRFMVIRLQRDRARLQAQRMSRMAHTDALTGLANRRAFDQLQRLEQGQALIIADLDNFKRINDTLGHQTGDAVLCGAARALRREIGKFPEAMLFRLGGEEFAIVLRCAGIAELEDVCEHVRRCFAEAESDGTVDLTDMTISVGALLGTGQNLHDAFAEADGAMYRAKDLGRNRTVLAPLGPEGAA